MPLSHAPSRAILSAAGALALTVLFAADACAAQARIDPVSALRAVSHGTAMVLGASAVMGAGVGVMLAQQHRRSSARTAIGRQETRKAAVETLEGEWRLPLPPPVYGGAWEEPAYGDDFAALSPEPDARGPRGRDVGAPGEFGFPPRRGPTRRS